MKRLLLPTLLLTLAANTAFAQYSAVGKVLNSKHDLAATSTAVVKASDLTQTCAFCHVAHKATAAAGSVGTPAPAGNQTPLWNHQLGSTISGVYGGTGTFASLNTDIAALGAATWGTATSSHLCMACHDGTIGVNAIYKFTATVGAIANHTDVNSKLISNSNLGTNLSSTHPVNFTYQGAAWLSKQTHVAVPSNYSVGTTNLPLDAAGKLQCSTCHSVHDPTNTYFLRDVVTGSKICLDCHLAT